MPQPLTRRASKKSKRSSDTFEDESALASAPEAFRRLRDLIVNGQLPPGAPVTERKVADRLQVSRTPVRSALHRLQQEGFLTAVGTGAERRLIVAPMTSDDGAELYMMVGHLEGLAARRAAQLPTAERKALVARLRELNRELNATLKDGIYLTKAFELDEQFHQAFVDAAAGPRLRQVQHSIKIQIERYAKAYIGVLISPLRHSIVEHDLIIRHIAAGEPKAAQDAVEANWEHATERLVGTIEKYGERGTWHHK